MRIASRAGRLIIVDGDLCTDVATASNDRFGPDPDDIYEHWADFASWAENQAPAPGEPFDPADVDAPLRRPRQVFGIGLNTSTTPPSPGSAPRPRPRCSPSSRPA